MEAAEPSASVETEERGPEPEAAVEPSGPEPAQEAGPEATAAGTPPDGAEETPAPEPEIGPGERLSDDELVEELCALLFASPDPLPLARLVDLLRRPARKRVRAALEALAARFGEARIPIVLREIAGGWRLLTDPDQHAVVARLSKSRKVERVTPAALETLAIVAYRQPVTKAEIEAIRGVQAGPVLRNLVDRGLIKVVGRADQPGSPLEYGTTREFLDRFGLASLKELPRDAELVRD